ncbi:MAG: Grx4 family monothiol glutaredoxin [Rickettsiaceae bacterium]|nr:Grx4 family monothiol glutaredoxin [Rickettsiaceae bacterium]
MINEKISDFIQAQINSNKIVLFMKGSADFPQCGFSANVVSILQKMNVPFKDINVLDSLELRQGIKNFSDWPTIPQLYVNGEFIGGCDIVKEMYQSGELQQLINHN